MADRTAVAQALANRHHVGSSPPCAPIANGACATLDGGGQTSTRLLLISPLSDTALTWEDQNLALGPRLVGIAVDVSGSMQTSIRNAAGPSLSRFESIRDALQTISGRVESVLGLGVLPQGISTVDLFAYGFGLKFVPSGVGDLLALMEVVGSVPVARVPESTDFGDPVEELQSIAEQQGRAGWGIWIADNITAREASNLALNLRNNPFVAAELGRLLPDFSAAEIRHALVAKEVVADPKGKGFWARMREARELGKSVKRGEISPKRITTELVKAGGKAGIERQVSEAQDLVRRLAEEPLVREQLLKKFGAEITGSISSRLEEMGDVTVSLSRLGSLFPTSTAGRSVAEDFIYGGTPMCRALLEVEARFARERVLAPGRAEVLLIVSDGMPMDGDPLPIADRLRSQGVTVISCLVTDRDMQEPRVLPAKQDRHWTRNTRLMYKLASPVDGDSAQVRQLVDWGWTIPPKARSFAQVNHSEVLAEFLKATLG